ncbi:MAG: hypothetical protein R2716_04860 [Microthrixaceae bacterium]
MQHHEGQHEEDSPLREVLTANLRERSRDRVASGYGIVFYISLVYPTFASEVGVTDNDVALGSIRWSSR